MGTLKLNGGYLATKGGGCDEKWSPGHKCKKKELNVLITHDEEDDEEPEEAPVIVDKPVLEAVEISEFTEAIEVSLNSVVGLMTPKTMKIKGIVGQQQVVILIDPDATHNFISAILVQKLKLPITRTKAYGVTMRTRDSVKGDEVSIGQRNDDSTRRSFTRKNFGVLKAMMRTCKHEGGLLVELNQVTIPTQTPVVPEFLIHVVEKYPNAYWFASYSWPRAFDLAQGWNPFD
ncbi:hypothetical protein LWI29_010961 [Acer saccharum]|uniref:Uncharacterized protein n=1 Tax=Acer saccharum TaxID=4024 RepID=A0AA39SSF9_ACESA|nr:hypothetical protein LWI29_010961 [Acer saccharum]